MIEVMCVLLRRGCSRYRISTLLTFCGQGPPPRLVEEPPDDIMYI